jgi:hypothetical protein
LNVDYDLRLAQPIGKPFIFAPQFLILTGQRIGSPFRAALLRGQAIHDSGLPLPPPFRQMRRVKALATQKGADLAGAFRCIRLGQNLLFVFGGVPAPLRAGHHFRIEVRRSAPAPRDITQKPV